MTWTSWLIERACMLWGMWLIGIALKMLENALFIKRVYRSSSSHKTTMEAIDALNKLPGAVKFGMEIWQSRMVPAVLIRHDIFAISTVQNEGIHGDAGVTIAVYCSRHWGACRGKPIIPDNNGPKLGTGAKTIEVIEKCSNKNDDTTLVSTTELTLPLCGIDGTILLNSRGVADIITDHYRSGLGSARVYIIHGNPGCGKSTMLRILAENIDGVLFPCYNPTNPSFCFRAIINDYASESKPLIIAYEEFDVSFKHIVAETVSHYDGMTPDAVDKASWNTMLDTIKRKTNVILVMITNKTYDNIVAMCRNDMSLIRYGRIDSHFVWPVDGKSPIRLDPVSVVDTVVDAGVSEASSIADDSVNDSVSSTKKKKRTPWR